MDCYIDKIEDHDDERGDRPSESLVIHFDDGISSMTEEYIIPENMFWKWENVTLDMMKDFDGFDDDTDETVLTNFGYNYIYPDKDEPDGRGVTASHEGNVTYKTALILFQKARDYEDLGEVLNEEVQTDV